MGPVSLFFVLVWTPQIRQVETHTRREHHYKGLITPYFNFQPSSSNSLHLSNMADGTRILRSQRKANVELFQGDPSKYPPTRLPRVPKKNKAPTVKDPTPPKGARAPNNEQVRANDGDVLISGATPLKPGTATTTTTSTLKGQPIDRGQEPATPLPPNPTQSHRNSAHPMHDVNQQRQHPSRSPDLTNVPTEGSRTFIFRPSMTPLCACVLTFGFTGMPLLANGLLNLTVHGCLVGAVFAALFFSPTARREDGSQSYMTIRLFTFLVLVVQYYTTVVWPVLSDEIVARGDQHWWCHLVAGTTWGIEVPESLWWWALSTLNTSILAGLLIFV